MTCEKALRAAASEGQAAAHTELGCLLYSRNEGSDRDEAISHWRSGALSGDLAGAFNLGRYLSMPQDHDRRIDLEEAHYWLRKATAAEGTLGIEAKEALGVSLINQAIGDADVDPGVAAADPKMVEGLEFILVSAADGREDSVQVLRTTVHLTPKIDASEVYRLAKDLLRRLG